MSRPRLLQRLDDQSPLTVLRAPLGFGKTTLVAQWWWAKVAERFVDVAGWVTVDADAADAAGFWQSMLDVLVDAGLDPPAPEPTRSTRDLARRAIAGAGCEVTLVVDAFERVTDDGIDADLLEVLRVSPNLRLVVCLRSRRHFQPHSFLDLDFTVIPPGDLLLSVDETAALARPDSASRTCRGSGPPLSTPTAVAGSSPPGHSPSPWPTPRPVW